MSKANDLSLKIAGRNLTPQEVSRLAVLREAMGIRETDALMPLTILLMHQEAVWEKVPAQIQEAAKASAEDARTQAEVILAEAVKSASPQLAERISKEIGKQMAGVTDALRHKWFAISSIAMTVLIGAAGGAGWWIAETRAEAAKQSIFEQGIAWCRENPAKCLGRKP